MKRYWERRRPPREAVQFTGDNVSEVASLTGQRLAPAELPKNWRLERGRFGGANLVIGDGEIAAPGDWIVKAASDPDVFVIVREAIFERLFEAAE